MKKFKKVASLILGVCILLTMAAGCGSSTNEPSGTTAATTVSTTAATTAEPQKEGPSYSWDTSPWDLGEWYWGQVGFTYEWDMNVLNVKAMFEKTGLRSVTFVSSATEDQEKLNAMIAAKSLPEVISLYNYGNAERMKMLTESGLVEDLLPLMEQYAPTFKERVPQELINWFSKDGKLYGFPSRTSLTGRMSLTDNGSALRVPFVRKDIAEQLGITAEDFKTQDGMVTALKKFKDSGIKQDGVEMLPMVMTQWTSPYQNVSQLAEYFGLKFEDSSGNYVPAIKNPKYKEMTQFMNRLFREGLFTEQNIMMKNEELSQLIQNKRIFMSFGNCSEPMKYIYGQIDESQGKIDYIPVEPVRSADGSKPEFTGSAGIEGESKNYITKDAKNKDRIIRFFEYLYSEEGQIQNEFGSEGVTYKVRENGLIEATPEFAAEMAANRKATILKYGVKMMPMLRDSRFISKISYKNFKPDSECTLSELTYRRITNYPPAQGELNDLIYGSFVEPPPGTEEADINTKITIYMDQQVIKMITAKSDSEFEALWNEAMDYCDKAGLQKLADAQNKNYLAAKKQMGVDFTYSSNKK